MLFQLLIFNVSQVASSFFWFTFLSFSQCLLHAVVKTWCLFPSLHGRGCTFQRGWRSIRREKAWAVLWYWVVWLLWMSTTVNPGKLPSLHQRMNLISNWSWLLRDSTCSDAKPSLEEALQKCSDVTLWFAKSDAFGHFWTLLDTFEVLSQCLTVLFELKLCCAILHQILADAFPASDI